MRHRSPEYTPSSLTLSTLGGCGDLLYGVEASTYVNGLAGSDVAML